MIELLVQALPVLHSSDSGGGGFQLALVVAGPVAGTALYAAVYRYYRNADKTDEFERETKIELKTAIGGQDEKVDEVKGTRDRRIDGDNARDFRRRVAKLD